MTVGELIKKLQELPQDMKVVVASDGYHFSSYGSVGDPEPQIVKAGEIQVGHDFDDDDETPIVIL